MTRVTWVSLAGLILAASGLYTLMGIRPSEYPSALLYLPLLVGTAFGCLYVFLVSVFGNRLKTGWKLAVTRQGLLLGLLISILLYLQGLRIVSWLESGLLTGAVILLELFFQAEKTDTRTPKDES